MPGFITTMLFCLMLPLGAHAGIFSLPRNGTAPTYHSLDGQAGVLRMTLSNTSQYLVVKTGDKRGHTGELNRINLKLINLTAPNEYDTRSVSAPFFHNQTRGRNANTAYVPIHKHDIINLVPRRPINPMWIYVRPGDRVRIEVKARELDCTKKIVCGRGDNSHYFITMVVPNFRGVRLDTCGNRNRWNLHQTTDGRFRFWTIGQNPISEGGDLRIYPVKGTLCFTSRVTESISHIVRPLQQIISIPGLFNKSKSKPQLQSKTVQ